MEDSQYYKRPKYSDEYLTEWAECFVIFFAALAIVGAGFYLWGKVKGENYENTKGKNMYKMQTSQKID